ncbi:hypothetical protein BD410DRAFT_792702 [Rickenella mellea]|uniref:DUF6533 domain-containing protein n=1 Tax=Rickenella mellea TaxID=50990 RepID=A0A4Y7PUV6_9AGAM|nr:hypothetical protein BD410DRAFT_792702 [Rickenella mellea]
MDTGFSGDLGSVTLLVFRTRAVNYVNVASTALLAYDFLLTLGDEIRLMWSARWNASKLLFFATRYPVFIHCSLDLAMYLSPSMSSNMCAPVYKAVGWLSIIAIMTAELILFMRTYAIYGRSRSILIFFAIIAVGLGIPAVILLNLSLNSVKFLPKSPLTTLAPCVPYSADRIVFLDFYFLMAFELVVVVLTAWKGVYKWRENRGPLIVTFVKDGVFYFLTLFASSLANAVVMMDAPLAYFGLMLQVQRVLHAMLSARVLLHIRATVDQDEAFSWPNPATLSWAPNREFMTTTVTNNVTTNFTSDIELTSSQSTSRPDYP